MCCAVGKYFTPTLKKQSFDSVQGRRITFSYISSLEWSATPANVPLTVIITYLKYRLHLERFHRLVNLRFKYGIQEYLSSSSPQKIEVDAISITNDSRSQVLNSPPHIQRQNSLRTKLSLPNLRRKKSRNNVNEDPVSSSPSMTGSLISHAPQDAAEMLQVKDTEFELVWPNFAHFQGAAARTSEDSGVLGHEGSIDLRQKGYLHLESPVVSVSSGEHSLDMWPQPPTTTMPGTSSPTTGSESSMEAHQIASLSRCR